MPLNFNLLRSAGPANFAEGLMQGQEQQNVLAQQQQQRQLSDIQLRNALRGEQEAIAESEATKGAASLEELAGRYRKAGLGKQALATEAALAKQRMDKLSSAKTQFELMESSAKNIMANPASAIRELTRYQQLTGVDMSDDIAEVQKKTPEEIYSWAAGHALKAEKMLPQFKQFTVPGQGVQTGTTDYAGKFTPDTLYAEKMSPYQEEQNKIAQGQLGVSRQRLGLEGQRVGLERERVGIARTEAERKAAGGDLKPVPVHAQKAITGAAASVGKLTDAIDLLSGLEVAGQKGSATATGLKGYTPDIALNRLDPKGTVTRAAIADIGSMIMHDRSGAAVTASESPRLKPFIPLITDSVDTARKKLERLRQIQLDDAEALTGTYNPEQGYRSFKVPSKNGGAAPAAAPKIAPPSGFTPD